MNYIFPYKYKQRRGRILDFSAHSCATVGQLATEETTTSQLTANL